MEVTAVPWYRSKILQGLLTILVSQIIAKTAAHFDLTSYDLNINGIVQWLMDVISAGAIAYSTHARVAPSVPIPPIVTLTQKQADKANQESQ